MRSGRFVRQLEGYVAFEAESLPPKPAVRMAGPLELIHADASVALGRLDGVTGILPNPDLFVAMYVRQEAVLSSQIEGTQASLTDVLQYEVDGEDLRVRDVEKVVNYVAAMNYGLERLETLPLSLRLIREIHGRLMKGVRGQHLEPGEFRKTQNWIGPKGCSLSGATFVPPPPRILNDLLGNLERFIRDDTVPPLMNAGLAHAQFETIHPFLDGNGRIGRLLVTFLLCQRKVLSRPLLYLSAFLKRNRAEYYDRLQAVRSNGAWEPWIGFFLRGVRDAATEAHQTALKILALREKYHNELTNEGKGGVNMLRALDTLFAQPIVTARSMEGKLEVAFATANGILGRFEELGILREMTGSRRNRRWTFQPYLDLFEQTVIKPDSTPPPELSQTG